MKEKTIRSSLAIPAWLFVMANVLYQELALHLWITPQLHWGRLAAVTAFALGLTAFALGLGAVLALLTSLLPSGRWVKWTSVAVSVLVCALWLTEYFLSQAFGKFMIPTTILGGAGGVARDFAGEVKATIFGNWWRIVLMLLPSIAYGLLAKPRKAGWKQRGCLAAAGVGLYLAGLLAVYTCTPDWSKLDKTYEFDSAVGSFGLNVSLILELTQGGSSAQPEFVPTQLPETTQLPVKPQSTESGEEPAVVYGENVLPQLDFAQMAKEIQNPTASSICQYLATLTPSQKSAYTGLFAGKNLILITAEAFTKEVIDPERTPTLYRMATQGIAFQDYYQPAWGASTITLYRMATQGIAFQDYYQPAWGASTISGEFSNLTGLVPTNGGSCMKEVRQQNLFLTMGHQLQRQGYYSTAYHNHLKDFYDRDKTHTLLGYDQYLALYGGLDVTPTWPESDREMIDITLPQYIDHQPFSIYYMTVSGHSMYSQKENAMSRKHYDKVAQWDHSDKVKCYYAGQLELEDAMTALLTQLELAGIADDTVVVLATDHYP